MRSVGNRRRPSARKAQATVGRHPDVVPVLPLLTNRRRRIILCLLLSGLAGMCLTALLASPLVAVRHISVSGLASLAPDEVIQIRARAELAPDTQLFRGAPATVADALRSLPCIAGVHVSRRFPDRLEVRVIPRRPVAILMAQNGRWEVDPSAVPIRSANVDTRMPEIVVQTACLAQAGVPVDAPGVVEALSVVAVAARQRPLPIAKIEVDQNADICLNMQDKVAIRLGHVEDLDAKLSLVRRIYAEEPDISTHVESIDLHCAAAPACLPRETAAKPSEDAAARRLRLRPHGPPYGRRRRAGSTVLYSSPEH